jgi:hypothetical protein
MSGTPYNSNNRQGGYHQANLYSNNGQNNETQSDPAWAAYYAAQAAVAQKQQQQQQQVSAADAGGADAYYEQFFRYAYYYGEEAARQYYGSWSPPEGTPNPYGINPNPSAAPLTNEGGGAGTVAPAGSHSSQAPVQHHSETNTGAVRDSSVRKVSNLPAWMTKS